MFLKAITKKNECVYALNVKMMLTISTKIENSSYVAHP